MSYKFTMGNLISNKIKNIQRLVKKTSLNNHIKKEIKDIQKFVSQNYISNKKYKQIKNSKIPILEKNKILNSRIVELKAILRILGKPLSKKLRSLK